MGKKGKESSKLTKDLKRLKKSIKAAQKSLHELELKADDLNANLKPNGRIFIFRRNKR